MKAPGARGGTTEEVSELFRELLEVPSVGPDDDFFSLGGQSLLAAVLCTRIREELRVELPVRAVFEDPTVAGISGRVDAALAGDAPAGPALERVERGGRLGLSSAQERMWLYEAISPGTLSHHLHRAYRLSGPLDPVALTGALGLVGERHEALRTTFGAADGVPFQAIQPAAAGEHALEDLSGLAPQERDAAVAAVSAEQLRRSFDLTRGPLWRTRLLRLAPDSHVLLLTLHHLVGDGFSQTLILDELLTCHAALAAGMPPSLPPLQVHAADVAAWERRRVEGGALDPQRAYWREMLREAPAVLSLRPGQRTRGTRSHAAGRVQQELPANLAAALRELGRREGASLFATLLAALQLLLARLTGEDDVVVGAPLAGRDRVELRAVVAPLLNMLPLRTRVGLARPFRELLGTVGRTVRGALAAGELPFERIVADCAPSRVPGRNPFFEIVLNLMPPLVPPDTHGLAVEVLDQVVEDCEFELMLRVLDRDGTIVLRLEHQLERLGPDDARTLLAQLVHLLGEVASRPELPAGDHPLAPRPTR